MRWGNKGSLSMVWEVIISLLLLGIFVIATYPYIFQHANGETYFSRFYAVDLATSADIVNAGYGDTVLRYDNLKQNLDLTFWVDNGIILVGKLPDNTPVDKIPALFLQRPPNAIAQYYGKAKHQPALNIIQRPAFLVLRKSQDNFAITEAETTFKECPAGTPAIPAADAKVAITVHATGGEQIEARANELLKNINLKTVPEEQANVKITLDWSNGAANQISVEPTSADGRAYGCIFAKRLAAITLAEYATNEPSSSGTAFDVKITMTSKDPVTQEQVAQAIANALAVYYR